MKVDQASPGEPHRGQTTGTSTSSAASTSSPRISMLKGKSGFVIPKNKLSGSLVPIFRGGKKQGGNDAANEEIVKEVHRKTKWGSDLTQDATVRRGRFLAYQTRVDQITQQLKSRNLEIGDDQDSQLATRDPDQEPSSHQINHEKLELLELERREAIGEILKLNPNYKPPSDYKPLLKEAKVPIPVKEYPGYNFLGLIYGPGSDTQKRLEKETGAKVQVYGTKGDRKEKVELTSSDEKENQSAYEELYVLVSAGTYEKVDAAVSLIELLVNPVSVKSTSVSGDDINVLSQSNDAATPRIVPTAAVSLGVVQSVLAGPTQNRLQGQFQYNGQWFPTGPTHTPFHPPSGFIPSSNPTSPIFNYPPLLSSFNPSSVSSPFGPRRAPATGFGSILPNPSLIPPRSQPPMQVLQHPFMPQSHPFGQTSSPSIPVSQSSSAQPHISVPHSFTGGQPTRPGMLPAQPYPAASSTGWSGTQVGTPASVGQNSSTVHMAPPFVPPRGPHVVVMQPNVASMAPPSNSSTTGMVSPVAFPSQHSTHEVSNIHFNRSTSGPGFSPGLPPLGGPSPASSNVPQHLVTRTSVPNPSPNSVLGSGPNPYQLLPASRQAPPSGIPSPTSVTVPSFTPITRPPFAAPKPQPNSGNFTFQPHRPQNPNPCWPVNQPGTQNSLPPRPALQPPLLPQTPSSHSNVHNFASQPVMPVFQRPQFSNQTGQSQAHSSAVPFGRNPNAMSTSPNFPAFPGTGPPSTAIGQMGPPSTAIRHMGPRNFSPDNQMLNLAGPLSSRPGNYIQFQQDFAAPATRPGNFSFPHQLSNNPSFAHGRPASSPSGGQRFYDPFSPTAVPHAPRQQGDNLAKSREQENDPEYDDLMASVGVK